MLDRPDSCAPLPPAAAAEGLGNLQSSGHIMATIEKLGGALTAEKGGHSTSPSGEAMVAGEAVTPRQG